MSPKPADLARADQWVRQGFQLQNAGQAEPARQAYLEALKHVPEHPAALQLLGLMARRAGQWPQAEELMRRSLRADPRQPHVWNNLGSLLDDLGRTAEALDGFERAIALEPRYSEARYNRALLLHQLGRLPDALDEVQRLRSATPHAQPNVLQLQALIESDLGQLPQALQTLDQALALAPDHAPLHHNRATVLQRLHRHQDALQAHLRAQSAGLDAADAHYNTGNTLQSLGRAEEAVQAYRRALARDPRHALALFDLARLRWRLGEPDFHSDFVAALAADPGHVAIAAELGHLLYRAERFADAAAVYRQALQHAPQAALLHSGLGRSLARHADLDTAIAAHRRAVELAPADATVRASLAEALLQARQTADALAALDVARAQAPNDQYVLSLLGLAWRQLGDPRAAWLNDIDRFVRADDLPPPPGFSSMEAFNAALVEELAPLHSDRAAPVDQSLRRGTQTMGDIFEQGHPLVDALKRRIAESVDRYVAALPTDAAHPFLARRTGRWRFTDSWSSRLSRGGFHTNHVHPHGWLSSAYYAQVPEVAKDPARQQGWIQFGAPDFDTGLAQPVQRTVQPQAGRLVLFPSMMWHGTTPFEDQGPRITIAFDVVPLAAGSDG